MKIHHLRNATLLLTLGEHRLLVDPMLSDAGAMPGFKMFGGGRRNNPLVPLPAGTDDVLASVTGVVVTHEHPDHLDGPAVAWMKQLGLPVWANAIDAASLARKGLDVHVLCDGALGMGFELIRSRHGRGPLGWLMGPVAGYYFAHEGEPSVYLVGDSVLTEPVLDALDRLRPDVVVAPAGSANMGLGGDILFSVDELVTLVKRAPGDVVLNHLEALDHCPTTRAAVRARMDAEGLGDRVHVPADGASLSFAPRAPTAARKREAVIERPGLQKWVTARFAGTLDFSAPCSWAYDDLVRRMLGDEAIGVEARSLFEKGCFPRQRYVNLESVSAEVFLDVASALDRVRLAMTAEDGSGYRQIVDELSRLLRADARSAGRG